MIALFIHWGVWRALGCVTRRGARRAAWNSARNGAGRQAGKDERTDETAGHDRHIGKEERVVVFLDAVIRPEHLAALLADYADDRPSFRGAAKHGAAERGAALLILRLA